MLRPAGGTWFQDLFHSPRRGAFHRSLTVLVRYRSHQVFSLGPWAALLPTGFLVSGSTHDHVPSSGIPRLLRDSHPLRSPLPAAFGSRDASLTTPLPRRPDVSFNPSSAAAAASYADAGLGSSGFAHRYYRNPLCSSGYVRCFSSPGALPGQARVSGITTDGLPHSDTSGSLTASVSPEHFAAWPRPSSACCA